MRRAARSILALSLSTLATAGAGCALFSDPALEERFAFRESAADADELARSIAYVDLLYMEPRSVERVEECLRGCEASISPLNGYASLWRGARACYWLAENHPDPEICRAYALRGALIGAEAARLAPNDPASSYFHALNLGLLSKLEGRGVRRVAVMEKLALRVIELDERYENAGGHRFLGILYDQTKDNPIVALAGIDEALEHLRRACELSPEYSYNQLALAEALLEDDEVEEALERLRLVLSAAAPAGETAAHARWQERARALIAEHGGERS